MEQCFFDTGNDVVSVCLTVFVIKVGNLKQGRRDSVFTVAANQLQTEYTSTHSPTKDIV